MPIGVGIKNTDAEIRDGVWADGTKPNGADVSALATAAALAVVYNEIAAIEAKLDNPDTFKADVSALATAVALAVVDGVVDAIKVETDKLPGREITGTTASVAAATETVCSAVIGQSGERSILQGGIIRGVQTLNAGKKVTIRVYKYNGAAWDLVDSYDVTKDSGLEANIGQAAHNDYIKISVEHDDTVNRAFPYVFVIQDME